MPFLKSHPAYQESRSKKRECIQHEHGIASENGRYQAPEHCSQHYIDRPGSRREGVGENQIFRRSDVRNDRAARRFKKSSHCRFC